MLSGDQSLARRELGGIGARRCVCLHSNLRLQVVRTRNSLKGRFRSGSFVVGTLLSSPSFDAGGQLDTAQCLCPPTSGEVWSCARVRATAPTSGSSTSSPAGVGSDVTRAARVALHPGFPMGELLTRVYPYPVRDARRVSRPQSRRCTGFRASPPQPTALDVPRRKTKRKVFWGRLLTLYSAGLLTQHSTYTGWGCHCCSILN